MPETRDPTLSAAETLSSGTPVVARDSVAGHAGLDARDDRLQVMEESVSIGKRVVDTGGVRVSTRTDTVAQTARVSLEDLHVDVEHVPAGRFVDRAEGPVTDGDLTILPVYEERVVVEKRLWLVEEVHIRRRRATREVDVPVELRRQTAVVERIAPDESIIPNT